MECCLSGSSKEQVRIREENIKKAERFRNNMKQENKEKKKEELKELVLARIRVMPSNYKLSIGSMGTFTKEQLIEHVQKGDETGEQVIGMQMNFIKALTTGKLIEAINQ